MDGWSRQGSLSRARSGAFSSTAMCICMYVYIVLRALQAEAVVRNDNANQNGL
jgi:hypothetical protein